MPRSKVYRKASLKSPQKCEIHGDFSCIAEMNGAVRCAEKKQKRRSGFAEDQQIDATRSDKWNAEDIHITCNPLSTPYPYSTPTTTATITTATTTTATAITTTSPTMALENDEEPKGRSCGSFLPILALIPHSVISFQYLSPKMKFSWWRNKIS